MRKLFLLLTAICSLQAIAADKITTRQMLDNTAKQIRKAGAITSKFQATATANGDTESMTGTICFDGKQFKLTTPEMLTWFDGTTQWSMLVGDDEVNVTTPSAAELQAMNPYAFLEIYKQGFNYTMRRLVKKDGTVVGYNAKLTAKKKEAEIREMTLETDANFNLKKVSMRQGKNTWMHISILSLKGGQHFSANEFTFPQEQYPDCTIIDLR